MTNEGQFPAPTGKENDLLSSGPMCRYVDDLLPMMKVLMGLNQDKLKLDTKVLFALPPASFRPITALRNIAPDKKG